LWGGCLLGSKKNTLAIERAQAVDGSSFFKEGENVEMLVNMEWVQCTVSKAAKETVDIVMDRVVCVDDDVNDEDCDPTKMTIKKITISDVDPARVKAVEEKPQLNVGDLRPGSVLPGMPRDDSWDGY